MKYDVIMRSDNLKFNPKVAGLYESFPDAAIWDEEPFDCLLEVTFWSDQRFKFSCAENCGRHNVDEVTKEEYEEYSSIIGEPFMLLSSIGEFLQKEVDALKSQVEVEQYDLEEEANNLVAIITKKVQSRKA